MAVGYWKFDQAAAAVAIAGSESVYMLEQINKVPGTLYAATDLVNELFTILI